MLYRSGTICQCEVMPRTPWRLSPGNNAGESLLYDRTFGATPKQLRNRQTIVWGKNLNMLLTVCIAHHTNWHIENWDKSVSVLVLYRYKSVLVVSSPELLVQVSRAAMFLGIRLWSCLSKLRGLKYTIPDLSQFSRCQSV